MSHLEGEKIEKIAQVGLNENGRKLFVREHS